MNLIEMFPELGGRTIWANLPDWAARLVWNEIRIERELGHALPASGFYKSLAIKQVRQAQAAFAGGR